MMAFAADRAQRTCSLGPRPVERGRHPLRERAPREAALSVPGRDLSALPVETGGHLCISGAFDATVPVIDAAIPELESLKGTLGDSVEALTAALNAFSS